MSGGEQEGGARGGGRHLSSTTLAVDPHHPVSAPRVRTTPRSYGSRRGAGPRPCILLLLVVLIAPAGAAEGQQKRDETLQSEQKKLQQTQKRLKEEREKAAAARARETSLLAELEQIE